MSEKNTSKNIEKRKRRRYKKRVKTSVKIGVLSFILVVSLGSWIAYRFYLMKTYVNPFGEVDTSDEPIEMIDDSDRGSAPPEAVYEILNLGDGESIFIKCGEVEALIDTGTSDSSEALTKELKGRVSGKLDYLIITGPSELRTGGVKAVAADYHIGTCILGELGESGKKAVGADIGGKADRVVDGKSASYDFGEGVTLFVVKPDVSSADIKDKSLVTYFKVKERGFLAFSDAGREEAARAMSGIQSCEVIVLPQHGKGDAIKTISKSITASSYIASAAKDSGFPTPELKEMFYDRVFATGTVGSVRYLIKNGKTACSLNEDDYKALSKEGAEEPAPEDVSETSVDEEGAPDEEDEPSEETTNEEG